MNKLDKPAKSPLKLSRETIKSFNVHSGVKAGQLAPSQSCTRKALDQCIVATV